VQDGAHQTLSTRGISPTQGLTAASGETVEELVAFGQNVNARRSERELGHPSE
jgi:hypothetical protein